jgi:hypothetical protein
VIEVRVVAEQRQSLLPCQGSNLEIVLRYRLTSESEFVTDISVKTACF